MFFTSFHFGTAGASLSSRGSMDFDLAAAVDKDEVKKSEAKEVEGIFGFGKKDKDKDKDTLTMIRSTTGLKKGFLSFFLFSQYNNS
ncbi:hypothetical protein AMELA_G00098340 [Ameiurus melas]|uniref:Uncharacterized protein n=1 Tax=Ameiurus melas TaxID=219545 RepID=A0A7J6ASE8_AMEME|nr:hypothetical protein AMELA_G00098340 [Ameiurus melas]